MKSKTQDKSLINHYRNAKPFRLVDVICITILIIVLILSCIFLIPTKTGNYVVIYQSGELIYRYPLNKDAEIPLLEGKMKLIIKDNSARISYSNCYNQICLKRGSISKAGERIICTPNKVTILIEGGDYIVTGGVL